MISTNLVYTAILREWVVAEEYQGVLGLAIPYTPDSSDKS